EGAELVHHRVNRVLQLQNLPSHVHGNFLRQVAVGHRRGHGGNIAHLRSEVPSHGVHTVGQVLPGPSHSSYDGLTTQLPLGPNFAGDAGHFRGKGAELVHHGVDSVFELEDFPFDIDRDFFGQVTVSHGGCHGRDIAHLRGEIAGHGVHTLGQIFPGPGHAFDFSLPTQFAFGAHFAGHARDFCSERAELVDHRVDRVIG